MISMPLIKKDFKENWKLLCGNILFFCSYTAMLIGIFEMIRGAGNRDGFPELCVLSLQDAGH